MNKHASLLLTLFLLGTAVGALLVLLPSLLTPASFTPDGCQHLDCFSQLPFLLGLPLLLLGGAIMAVMTLLLARGIHRLFFAEQPPDR
ncbi:MAG: hypothetical protein R3E95_11265 [Thiolinea sp.]